MAPFTVHLGNTAPTRTFYPNDEAAKKGEYEREAVEGIEGAITSFSVIHGDVEDGLAEIHDAWTKHHSLDPPAWVHVECPLDPDLAKEVARTIRRRYSITEDDVALAREAADAAAESGDQPPPVPDAHVVGLGVPEDWVPTVAGEEIASPVEPGVGHVPGAPVE